MSIDEKELNKKLRKHTRAYARLKKGLQGEITKHVKKNKPTDLLWLCDQTGLSPQDAKELYCLLYDGIEDAPEDGYNLSTKKLDSLVLGKDEFIPFAGSYKLALDPEYTFRIIMVSDTHIGSRHDNIEGLERMFDQAVEIGAKGVFHSGDLTDGNFAHRDMHLFLRGDAKTFDGQFDRVVHHWPKREGITTYFIAGNHDHFAWQQPGADICRYIDFAREDMVYLKNQSVFEAALRKGLPPEVLAQVMESRDLGSGRVGAVKIGPYHLPAHKRNTILMMLHPGNGSAQTMSYKPQRIIANLDMLLHSFDNMKNPGGKRIKPHLLLVGHYHKQDVNLLRNVYVFQAGTMKLADQFHEVKCLNNMMGYWAVELTTRRNGNIAALGYRPMEAYVPKVKATRTVVDMKE